MVLRLKRKSTVEKSKRGDMTTTIIPFIGLVTYGRKI